MSSLIALGLILKSNDPHLLAFHPQLSPIHHISRFNLKKLAYSCLDGMLLSYCPLICVAFAVCASLCVLSGGRDILRKSCNWIGQLAWSSTGKDKNSNSCQRTCPPRMHSDDLKPEAAIEAKAATSLLTANAESLGLATGSKVDWIDSQA